jgi:hypothetical protein
MISKLKTKQTLRRIIVLGSPLTLGILDLFHPALYTQTGTTIQTGIFQRIAPVVNWWLLLHILQLPLFCLLALSAYLLLNGVQNVAAIGSRIAIGIFVIFYPAFDGLIGIGTGSLVRYATMLSSDQRALLSNTIDLFWQSPFATLLAVVGSVGWTVAILLAAVALSKPTRLRWPVVILGMLSLVTSYLGHVLGLFSPIWLVAIVVLSIAFGFVVRPHLPAALLLMASFLFSATHAFPFGPLGLACFLLAVIQLELLGHQTLTSEQKVSSVI